MRALVAPALFAVLLAGCASNAAPPSLLPRPAEAIDPRVEVVRPMNDRPVDAALAERLGALVGQARSGDEGFQAALGTASPLVAAAGAAQSESWIAAQQALSAAIAAREPVARALGDVDALGGDKLQANAGLAPNDLAAVQQAGAEVGAIDARETAAVRALQARLAR